MSFSDSPNLAYGHKVELQSRSFCVDRSKTTVLPGATVVLVGVVAEVAFWGKGLRWTYFMWPVHIYKTEWIHRISVLRFPKWHVSFCRSMKGIICTGVRGKVWMCLCLCVAHSVAKKRGNSNHYLEDQQASHTFLSKKPLLVLQYIPCTTQAWSSELVPWEDLQHKEMPRCSPAVRLCLGRWVCPGVCRDIETQCWQSPSIKERNTSYLRNSEMSARIRRKSETSARSIYTFSNLYSSAKQKLGLNTSWTNETDAKISFAIAVHICAVKDFRGLHEFCHVMCVNRC